MRVTGLVVAIVLILAATLLPWSNFVGHSHWHQVQWLPFLGHRLDWFDIVANIALFVPFGCFAGDPPRTPWRSNQVCRVLGAALLLSAAVEFMQIYSHGRFPSATDISCNLLGAALGLIVVARRRSNGFGWRKAGATIDA